MVLDEETMLEIELFSVKNEGQYVYAGDVPEQLLKQIQKINREYNRSMMQDFIKILPGKEMVDGKLITKKQLGSCFVCYVDRVSEEEVERMKEYDRKKKDESEYLKNFPFVRFVKG